MKVANSQIRDIFRFLVTKENFPNFLRERLDLNQVSLGPIKGTVK